MTLEELENSIPKKPVGPVAEIAALLGDVKTGFAEFGEDKRFAEVSEQAKKLGATDATVEMLRVEKARVEAWKELQELNLVITEINTKLDREMQEAEDEPDQTDEERDSKRNAIKSAAVAEREQLEAKENALVEQHGKAESIKRSPNPKFFRRVKTMKKK